MSVAGVIGAVVAVAVIAVANRTQKAAQKNAAGWKMLRPGWLTNFFLLLSAGLAALITWILLFVGSALPDAEMQMAVALMLAVGSWSYCLYLGWTGYGRIVMWKGNELRVRTVFGRERVRRIPDVSRVSKSKMLGDYKLTFRDGSTLWLSPYFHGSKELVKRLPKRARD